MLAEESEKRAVLVYILSKQKAVFAYITCTVLLSIINAKTLFNSKRDSKPHSSLILL
jgi:hypothetical protein